MSGWQVLRGRGSLRGMIDSDGLVVGKVLAVNPAHAGAWALTWVLTDLKPEVLERAGAAQIYGPSLPPRRDLQYPCRLLPWPAEVRVGVPSSRPRLAVGWWP